MILDRIPGLEPENRNHPVRALFLEKHTLQPRVWKCGAVLDQGKEGACVGFAVAAELLAEPLPVPGITNETGIKIYNIARYNDEYPGENYSGTSVNGGMRAAKILGYYGMYKWCFGFSDYLMTLSSLGPVILGIKVYTGMIEPDSTGRIRATGVVEGGHGILSPGWEYRKGWVPWTKKRIVWVKNSWGIGWGLKGWAWMYEEDMARLLSEQGEAAIPIERVIPNESRR